MTIVVAFDVAIKIQSLASWPKLSGVFICIIF